MQVEHQSDVESMQEQDAKEKQEKREKESAHKARSQSETRTFPLSLELRAWSYAAACIQQQRRNSKRGDTQTHNSSEAACLKWFEVMVGGKKYGKIFGGTTSQCFWFSWPRRISNEGGRSIWTNGCSTQLDSGRECGMKTPVDQETFAVTCKLPQVADRQTVNERAQALRSRWQLGRLM